MRFLDYNSYIAAGFEHALTVKERYWKRRFCSSHVAHLSSNIWGCLDTATNCIVFVELMRSRKKENASNKIASFECNSVKLHQQYKNTHRYRSAYSICNRIAFVTVEAFFCISVAQKRNTCTEVLPLKLFFFSYSLFIKKTLYVNSRNCNRVTASLAGSQKLFFMSVANANSEIRGYAKSSSEYPARNTSKYNLEWSFKQYLVKNV